MHRGRQKRWQKSWQVAQNEMTKAETANTKHRTVLLNETIDGLDLNSKSVVVDCTFGGGGHSREICRKFPQIKIVALDQDKSAGENMPRETATTCQINFHNANFRNLDKVLEEDGLGKVDAIIFDLGLSSDQIENSRRGFSFLKDEPLRMTMKRDPTKADLTAHEIVNTWEEKNLADIIYGYGEEKFAKRIARGIAEVRGKREIKTTFDLVKVIENSVPLFYRRKKIHFATRTFQAIRIAVNDELEALKEGLEKGFERLNRGGRIAVISFHSLEDRIVKRFFKEKEKQGVAKLLNKKPIVPTKEEISKNKRARSAKLRILSRIK